MNNNAANDVINIAPNNYVVDVSGINSLDNPQNDYDVNNGEIVIFQASDGSLHTISLTAEQIAQLGLQIQYPSESLTTEELPLQPEVVQEPESIILEAPLENITEAQIIYNEPIQVQQEATPLHRIVRVSELATRGRGFQLITDHIGNDAVTKTSENSLIKPRTIEQPKTIETIKKKQLPVSNTYINGSSSNDDPVLTGKFILTHNEIGSFKPNLKSFGNAKSVLLPRKQDKFCLKTTKLVSVPNPTAVAAIALPKVPIKSVKPRNGIQLKTISPHIKKTLNIKQPLTRIPIIPKTPRKVFIPEDPKQLLRWTPQSHKTVHVLQSGDQYQSVEKLNGDQLRVVTDALSNVISRPENTGNVMYDPSSKTRIVYRVVYPEDLNLYSTNTAGEENKKPKKDKKPKTVLPPTPKTPQVVSVTRSGRRVRLPQHMAMDYEQSGGPLGDDGPPSPPPHQEREERAGSSPSPSPTHKKRFNCPVCRKVYRGASRMARHLLVFPDHAITPKASEILAKYKSDNEAKEMKPKAVVPRKQILPHTETQISVSNGLHNSHSAVLKNDQKLSSSDLESKEERSLFTSLVGILERTSEECRATVFVRQLAALINKLRRLMPCLLSEDKQNSSCIINEPVGKILDVSPGKYRLNMEAIKCLGDQSESCKHVTPKPAVKITSTDSWMTNKGETNHDTTPLEDRTRKNSLDKWTTNVGKRKWIPIGSQNTNNDDHSNTDNENWLSTNSEMMTDNASFSQTVNDLKSWDSGLQKQSRVSESTPGSPWRANIAELAKSELPEQLPAQRHIIEPSNQPVQSDDSISFDCSNSKIVDIHSNLIFDPNNANLKSDLSHNGTSACDESGPGNYDFNDSRFDMQIDSDKLNFTSAQYNEMKYGRDALPPFRKIETSKNLQLPVDSLSDMSSDGDKLHLPTRDTILNDNSYQITSESLELSMENNPMDNLSVDVCKSVPLNQDDSVVHCDGQSLLNESDLNMPMSRPSTLSRNESILSVSESSLDEGRLNLSASQSVLHLLDPLGTDCLSFADSELRPTSQMSLDVELDLFPFHHP